MGSAYSYQVRLFQRGSAKSFSTGDALEQAQLLRRRAPHRVVVADHLHGHRARRGAVARGRAHGLRVRAGLERGLRGAARLPRGLLGGHLVHAEHDLHDQNNKIKNAQKHQRQ